MAVSDSQMHFPKVKNEITLTTVVTAFGFLLTIAGGGAVYGAMQAGVGALASEQIRIGERVEGNAGQVNRIPNLEYRITVQEQANIGTTQAIEEMRRTMADQSADLKVMREILLRVDSQMVRAAGGQ